MHTLRFIPATLFAGLLLLTGVTASAGDVRAPVSEEPTVVTDKTENEKCLDCHGVKGFAVPQGEAGEGLKRHLHVEEGALHGSVHTEQSCVDCHNSIAQIPHKVLEKGKQRTVECVQCHEKQALALKQADRVSPEIDISRTMVGLPAELKVLEKSTMQKEAGHYLASIHAKPRKDKSGQNILDKAGLIQLNATCADCHGKHDVVQMKTVDSESFRLNTPQMCGRCHEKQLKAYTNSVHGAAVKRHGKLEAAVCGDCHNAHKIASPEEDQVKLAITENCGSCHEKEVKSYRSTYHGQVAQLGYAHTAKCADCHAPHNTLDKDNTSAQIHTDNLVETCKECHKQATASFVKFQPHGNTHDFERFPVMWVVSKFMITLLAVVFLAFWGHSLLWFKRESKEPKHSPTVTAGEKYVLRFTWQVRLAHLLLALAVMVLALTGTTVLYADSFWAPTMMKLMGGPQVAAIIHRIAASLFVILFFGHLLRVLSVNLRRARANEPKFDWFGPDSLIPNKRDWQDLLAMKDWFAGKDERPVFEHWTYWEKFDYWAPFWGMFIIGTSGIMLWFSPFFGSFIPGWIFNVATIVHGEEAFLAIVFLFTVHFFNSHFRPDKFPMDIIMFTGSMPLEEFKHERADEYARLVAEGKLDEYLVEPPTEKMVKNSRILGFSLIGAGLLILLLVLSGFVQNLFG